MTSKHRLLTLSLLAALVLPISAQTPKIGTIDLRKVFDNYWKTKQADANLKDEAAGLDRERKTMLEQYQKAQEDYRKRLDLANDAALALEERDKRKKAAEDDLLKLKELQANLDQFERQARVTLGEKQRRMRDNILVEIKEVIKAKAKAGNFAFILDTAAESANSTPVLLYTSGQNDISDEVLQQLNANAPADLPKSSSETKPGKDDKK